MTTFTEHQRVLGLFADGVAGVAVPIEVVDDPTALWPWRTSELGEPVVRVPAAADDLAALRAIVLHHTGFVEFGTFDDGRPARERLLDSSVHPRLARRIFGALEDRRIDEATRRHYPGARRHLDAVLAAARARVPEAPPLEWRAALVESLQLHALGADREALLTRAGPRTAPALAALLERIAAIRTVDDSAAAAVDVVTMLTDTIELEGDPPPMAVVQAPDADRQGSTQPLDDRPTGDVPRPPSEDMEQADADGPRTGRLADVEALDPDLPIDLDDLERDTRTDPVLPLAADVRDARIYHYDEWDHLAGRRLPAWCRVVERRLDGDDRAFIGEVRRRHGTLINRLRRQLSFMRPEGWVRVHHADDGDELDLEAVIAARVDRRSGHTVDDRLHVRRDRGARDVATAFLVDLSASTSSPIPDEEADAAAAAAAAAAEEEEGIGPYRGSWLDFDELPPPEVRRRVLDVAKESVAVMCDALELLGDRHAVYGFSGETRHHVDVHVAKEFDDRTSPRTWAAIAAMRSLKYTRMGPAVRHATAKLAAQPSRTKLLIVISDGYPQDVDYGPDRTDREYGLQDTARALREAVDAGISPYLLTIDPSGHEYLRTMLPPRSYVVIEDVHSLPVELAALYGSVASAASRGW
jgi:nitric oxide reductase NorD protein